MDTSARTEEVVYGPCPCGRPIASLRDGFQRCELTETCLSDLELEIERKIAENAR